MEERRDRLVEIIRSAHSIHVRDMAAMFDVSTETIRKDLLYLEEQGIIKKNYGGAVVSREVPERAIEPRMKEHVEEKMRIANRALSIIPNKGILILDAGSTVYQFTQLLLGTKNTYTIITSSIAVAGALTGSNHMLLCIGGEVRSATMAMTGVWAINALASIKADVAILGTSGFMSHAGPCAEAFVEADVKKAMIQRSRQHIVLADSSKFQTDALVEYADWRDIDTLITDSNANAEETEKLREFTNVLLV